MTILGVSALAVAIVVVVAIVVLIALFRAMWRVAEPNEALVISGLHHKPIDHTGESLGFKIITGRGTLVIPGVQVVRRLSLDLRESELEIACVTKQGIPVHIKGVVIYKIGDDFASIANAARRFLDQQDRMDARIQNVFAGHLRAIVGSLTIEELIRERDRLTEATRGASGTEMEKLGLDRRLAADPGDRRPDRLHREPRQAARRGRAARRAHRAGAGRPGGIAARAEAAGAQGAVAARQQDQGRRLPGRGRPRRRRGETGRPARRRDRAPEGRRRGDEDRRARRAQDRAGAARDRAPAGRRQGLREGDDRDRAAQRRHRGGRGARQADRAAGAGRRHQDAACWARPKPRRRGRRGLAEGEAISAKGLAEAQAIKARADALAENQEAVICQQLAEQWPQIVEAGAKAFATSTR